MTDWYEVLERFSIIAESEGDIKGLQMIRKQYGAKWVEWLSKYLWGAEKIDEIWCTVQGE